MRALRSGRVAMAAGVGSTVTEGGFPSLLGREGAGARGWVRWGERVRSSPRREDCRTGLRESS